MKSRLGEAFRGWFVAANVLLCAPGLSAAEGLVLEYKTTGLLPGAGREEKPSVVRQRMTVDSTGTKLLYEETREDTVEARRIVLRMDGPKPIVYELVGKDGYREHVGDLNSVQEERDLIEAQQVLAARSLPAKEREAFFRENCGLRPDNERVVKVSRSKGETRLGRACERFVLTENCLTIVEGDIARVPVLHGGFFQLYRRLGAFSDKVLAELENVEGVLLMGKVTVVTALRPHELQIEATRVEPVEVAAAVFEVTGRRRIEEPKEVSCASCSKALDPNNKSATSRVPIPGGKELFSCAHERCLKVIGDRFLQGGTGRPGPERTAPPGPPAPTQPPPGTKN